MSERKIYDQMRRQSQDLSLSPSERVWDRLENRLDQDKGKVKLTVVKWWLATAASLAVIITGAFYLNSMASSTLQLLELDDTSPKPSFAAYHHASDINAAYENGNWQQIKEGSHRKLKNTGSLRSSIYHVKEDTL